MSNETPEDIELTITNFLRGYGGPAPFSIIAKQVGHEDYVANAISRLIAKGLVRENRPDVTYLRLTGETATYSLTN